MSRTAIFTALVLRNRQSGESNTEVTLLTAEEGIIRATVFGGSKSKLRAHSAPYNFGQVWIYRDKAKDYAHGCASMRCAKLCDFDVHSWRPGLRELYDRTMAAGAVSETILSSHGGGGDWAAALKMAAATLDTLENANEDLCGRLLIHFMWRWAHFLGIQPHLDHCAVCNREVSEMPLWYNFQEGTLCDKCIKLENIETKKSIKLNSGSCKWLMTAGALEPAHLHRYSMDNKSFHEAKSLAVMILTEALGKRLASWDW
jgi:DNA repair protein RecO (recombination protein O)